MSLEYLLYIYSFICGKTAVCSQRLLKKVSFVGVHLIHCAAKLLINLSITLVNYTPKAVSKYIIVPNFFFPNKTAIIFFIFRKVNMPSSVRILRNRTTAVQLLQDDKEDESTSASDDDSKFEDASNVDCRPDNDFTDGVSDGKAPPDRKCR